MAVDEVVALAAIGLPSGVVQIRIPDDLPLVRVDPGLLERVVANLLDNAVRHSPAGRRVEVGARVAGGGVELRVADHGAGVPAALWDSMFQPFQRLGDRATGAGAGPRPRDRARTSARRWTSPSCRPRRPGGGLTMALRLPLAPR